MTNLPAATFLAAGAFALAACSNEQPAPVPPPTTTVNRSHPTSRPSTSAASTNNPDNFEPVERPASYSR